MVLVCLILPFFFFSFESGFVYKLFLKVYLAYTQYSTEYIKSVKTTFQVTSDIEKATEIFIICYSKHLVNNGRILYQQKF